MSNLDMKFGAERLDMRVSGKNYFNLGRSISLCKNHAKTAALGQIDGMRHLLFFVVGYPDKLTAGFFDRKIIESVPRVIVLIFNVAKPKTGIAFNFCKWNTKHYRAVSYLNGQIVIGKTVFPAVQDFCQKFSAASWYQLVNTKKALIDSLGKVTQVFLHFSHENLSFSRLHEAECGKCRAQNSEQSSGYFKDMFRDPFLFVVDFFDTLIFSRFGKDHPII